jgi:hypothetical protein
MRRHDLKGKLRFNLGGCCCCVIDNRRDAAYSGVIMVCSDGDALMVPGCEATSCGGDEPRLIFLV